MDGKEYRIAFLTVDWNYELVESTLHGLKRYVDDHKNVHLFAFDCFGKNLDNAKDRSEYAIFDLPDLSTFDGLMIQGNQIVLQRIREKLEARIARARIPAVSIGCPMDGCTLVRIENQRAQHDITEHVIRKHHARRLVFITGILDNSCPEARQRRDGFMDACEENRIPRENITVIEGDWRNVTGKRIAEDWLEKGKKLPDAF
nr:hypothetical protein [Clostridiales bacterium]